MSLNASIGIAGKPGTVTTVVIGAGHAGLAISHCLNQRSIDHVVLERGEVANSWTKERWDSLRLLTPNWQNVLPGYRYQGDNPDGFMTMPEISDFIQHYAQSFSAPVHTGTTVLSVSQIDRGYRVVTTNGQWDCRSVVLANGACGSPAIPGLASELPDDVRSLSTKEYRNPDQLDSGNVLIIGASASGLQLAQEIQQSGRQVTLAVGEHVRMPRSYRGRDIQWWMDVAGILDRKISDEDDPARARKVPSPQLIGTPERQTLDLNALTGSGVKIVGRLAAIRENKALFSGSLRNCCAMADLKMNRLLDTFDDFAATQGNCGLSAPERFAATRIDERPQLQIDLRQQKIKTIIWATGYKPDYAWLDIPVLDNKGYLIHEEGVIGRPGLSTPGLYAMGLTYMRRRKSSFIYGAESDANAICNHLAHFLGGTSIGASEPFNDVQPMCPRWDLAVA